MRSPLFPPEIAEAIARTKESLDEYRLLMAIARRSSGEEIETMPDHARGQRELQSAGGSPASWEAGQSSPS